MNHQNILKFLASFFAKHKKKSVNVGVLCEQNHSVNDYGLPAISYDRINFNLEIKNDEAKDLIGVREEVVRRYPRATYIKLEFDKTDCKWGAIHEFYRQKPTDKDWDFCIRCPREENEVKTDWAAFLTNADVSS